MEREYKGVYRALRKHIDNYFRAHLIRELKWDKPPSSRVHPRFRVLEVAPGPKMDLWTYISMGAWEDQHEPLGLLEFMLIVPKQNRRHVESLAMIAYYHLGNRLGPGHTFPLGEPWVEGSRCDHMLVSRPYLFEPELEICELKDTHIHLLWLMPITRNERDFKIEYGQEALEQLFNEAKIQYWCIDRDSVV